MIVLDTHAAIWYAGGIKLRRAAMSVIESALKGAGAMLSGITAWEIGMLIAKKRITVSGSADEYVRKLFDRDGILEEAVSARIGVFAASLPLDFHGDPADRIIVATAAIHAVPLVTRDARILSYLRKTKLAPVIGC